MTSPRPWFALLSATLLTATLAAAPVHAVTLYDASAGTLPSAQGWLPLAAGGSASQSLVNGSYRLDTTAPNVVIWGNGRLSPVTLDTATGFDLSFRLQIVGETHASPNRSGYSVVMVGDDPTRSLEIAFWNDHVFVYDFVPGDPDRFVHGADAAFDTTAALTDYTLAVRNQQFTLSANGATLITGGLRDYTAEGLPYTTPNFLFFGDDSSRGTSISLLQQVRITAVPEPTTLALLLAGLMLVTFHSRRIRSR